MQLIQVHYYSKCYDFDAERLSFFGQSTSPPGSTPDPTMMVDGLPSMETLAAVMGLKNEVQVNENHHKLIVNWELYSMKSQIQHIRLGYGSSPDVPSLVCFGNTKR